MPRFFLHHQIDLAQRDGKKMLLSMITADSRLLCLDFDFPENYTHINQVLFASHSSVDYLRHTLTVPFVCFIVGTLQLMSQMKWFKKLYTVILIFLAHYYDYVLGRHAFVLISSLLTSKKAMK